MLWHAMPPELNTTRLMVGAGPAPMLQAAAGWEALGMALDAQSAELAAILTGLAATWTGASGERAIAAAAPMVTWLQTVAAQAQKRALQAAAQAAAYTTALATTPSLPEIAANHVTRAVLVATNFFGINMVPIGLKETDYFVRMWNQAAGAMDVYAAQSSANTMFEPLPPMKPIVDPGAGEAAQAGALSTLAEMASKAANSRALGALASEAPAIDPYPGSGLGQQIMPFLSQMGQLSGPMQQLTQLMQQKGAAGGLGGNLAELADRERTPQMGLLGASPLSTHPLAGGSGPSTGAGLLRAESLPGLGGSSARTPLLSQLLDKSVSVAPAAAGAAAAGSAAMGGGAPLGMMGGQGAQAGVVRPMSAAPAVLAPHPDETGYADQNNGDEQSDDGDDW